MLVITHDLLGFRDQNWFYRRIGRTPTFDFDFGEKKCGLYAEEYGSHIYNSVDSRLHLLVVVVVDLL